MRPERLCQRKSSNDTIGNRTRGPPACSAVPQPTATPRTPSETSGNGTSFPPSTSIFPRQYHPTIAPHSSSSAYHSYNKDKRAKLCGGKTRVFFLQWHSLLLFPTTVVCCHHIQHCALKEEFSVTNIGSETRLCTKGEGNCKNVF
jgi:hypothetical protein